MKPVLKRPFAFWLPAFILLFLLYAWVDSCSHSTRGTLWHQIPRQGTGLESTLSDSRFTFGVSRFSGLNPMSPGIETWFDRNGLPAYHASWWFPLPAIQHEDRSNPAVGYHIYRVILPLWFLVLAHIALWLMLLAWHRRRIKRHSSLPPAQPHSGLKISA